MDAPEAPLPARLFSETSWFRAALPVAWRSQGRETTLHTMRIRSLLLHGTSLTLILSYLFTTGCGSGGQEEVPASRPPESEASNSTGQPSAGAKGDGYGGSGDSPAPGTKAATGGGSPHPLFPEGADPVATMYAYIDGIQARPDVKENLIKVQHILIGVGPRFGGAEPAEAEKRAAQILEELAAAGGENFDELVKKHTNDAYPGIYSMILEGNPDRNNLVFRRDQMVAAFGDVGWKLQVGEVGISPYDPRPPAGKGTSYYGLHIIKRIE